MCARRMIVVIAVAACLPLAACSSERTGSAFCAQLGKEIPDIALPVTTKTEAQAIVDRYQRLLDVAPLSIEKDINTVTDLLRLAARTDTKDAAAVQKLADASYASKQAALNVREWAKSTCAIDISTGSTIVPPRTAPPSTPAPATTGIPPASSPPEASTTTAG